MNRDDIIRWAREAGIELDGGHTAWMEPIESLERFANLVAAAEREANLQQIEIIVEAAVAAEREACAQIAEREAMTYADPVWAVEIVNDIRARDPNYIAPKPEPFDPVAYREMIDKVTKTALKILDDTLAKQGKP